MQDNPTEPLAHIKADLAAFNDRHAHRAPFRRLADELPDLSPKPQGPTCLDCNGPAASESGSDQYGSFRLDLCTTPDCSIGYLYRDSALERHEMEQLRCEYGYAKRLHDAAFPTFEQWLELRKAAGNQEGENHD